MKNIQSIAAILIFSVFGTMAFGQIKVVAPNGDVGIGTSTPSEKLEVNGGVLVGNTTNTNAGTIRYNGTDLEGYVGGSWTSLTATGGGGSSVWNTTGTAAHYNAGNVGIGTSTPSEKLHVDGATFAADGFITSNGSARSVKYSCFGDDLLARNLFRPESPSTNGFYISGNGTGTLAGYRTQFAMFGTDYGADDNNWYAMFLNAGPSNNGINMHKKGNAGIKKFSLSVQLQPKFTMTPQGRIGIGTTNPSAQTLLDVKGAIGYNGTLVNTSDRRLKTNVSDFDYGLDAVLALDPIFYSYTGDLGTNAEGTHVGIFAQDLQEVAPETVIEASYIEPEYTVKNEDSENPELVLNTNRKTSQYLAIQESSIKYMLINAIQDQQVIIDDQNESIEALTKKLEELEVMVGAMAAGSMIKDVELDTDGVLMQNQPNPFDEETLINYLVPKGAKNAAIYVRDLNGKNLKTIVLDSNQSGTIRLNANSFTSGTYTYSLVVDGVVIDTKKMVFTK